MKVLRWFFVWAALAVTQSAAELTQLLGEQYTPFNDVSGW